VKNISEIDKLVARAMGDILREQHVDLGNERACIGALIGLYRGVDIMALLDLAIEKAKGKPQTAGELP
jgi:hypothetical protein